VPSGTLDCDDDNDCTLDSCDPEAGCVHDNKVGPCDDGNPCTAGDICVNGVCVGGEFVPGCCNSDEDCDDGWPCTIGVCEDSGCTAIPADCDDGNECTSDACYDGACHNAPLVQGQIVWAEDFDDGFADAWSFTSNSNKVGWQVDGKRFVSEPNSLYLGNPAVHNYQDGNKSIKAGARTPPIHLPEAPLELRFRFYSAPDKKEENYSCPYDSVSVRIDGAKLYEKCGWNSNGWVEAAVDVTGYAGQDVVVEFYFDSKDGLYNNGEGFYVDDLEFVVSGDVEDCCDEDSDCDDDNQCTDDSCDPATSECTFDPQAMDGEPCDDGNPCTVGDACLDGECVPGENECGDEICDNDEDDDGDGAIDCDDPDCADSPACAQADCETDGKAECNKLVVSSILPGNGGLLDEYSCSNFKYPTDERIYEFVAACNGGVTATLTKKGQVWPPDDGSGMLDLLVLDADAGCTGDACIAAGLMESSGPIPWDGPGDPPWPGGDVAKATFSITQGHTYYLVVDGRSGGSGMFTLGLACMCVMPG